MYLGRKTTNLLARCIVGVSVTEAACRKPRQFLSRVSAIRYWRGCILHLTDR